MNTTTLTTSSSIEENVPYLYQLLILNQPSIIVNGLYTMIVHLFAYWVLNLPFIYYQFEKTRLQKVNNSPSSSSDSNNNNQTTTLKEEPNRFIKFLDKYSIHPNKQPIPQDFYNKILTHVFFIQFFLALPLSLLLSTLVPNSYSLHYNEFLTLNYFLSLPFYFFVFILCDEFIFYFSHYFLHKIPFLYKTIHYKHHELQYSVSVGCIYAHPLEFLFGNLLPVLSGPFLLRPHITIYWFWILCKMLETSYAHSGFEFHLKFPFIESINHSYHHSHYQDNYGSWYELIDRFIMKTNLHFEEWKRKRFLKKEK
ncbi:hypothetical protein ABK040_002167 [Willaertia magna]